MRLLTISSSTCSTSTKQMRMTKAAKTGTTKPMTMKIRGISRICKCTSCPKTCACRTLTRKYSLLRLKRNTHQNSGLRTKWMTSLMRLMKITAVKCHQAPWLEAVREVKTSIRRTRTWSNRCFIRARRVAGMFLCQLRITLWLWKRSVKSIFHAFRKT